MSFQARDQLVQLIVFDCKAGCRGMAAVPDHQIRALVECVGDVKLGDRAAGAARGVGIDVGYDSRAIIGLGQARGCQADHARVEALVRGKEQEGLGFLCQGDGFGLGLHLARDALAFAVLDVQLLGQLPGAA